MKNENGTDSSKMQRIKRQGENSLQEQSSGNWQLFGKKSLVTQVYSKCLLRKLMEYKYKVRFKEKH